MNIAPLIEAPFAIQLHAYAALGAFVLGAVQLARVKGTTGHRAFGYIWAGLMLIVAISSFWIHEIRLWGAWSPIHLLAIFTLVMLPFGVWRAHRHDVSAHQKTMVGMYAGALIIAGIFTFAPGRIMYRVIFGG